MRRQGKNAANPGRVYLLVLTGEVACAQKFVESHFPGHECVVLSKRELRESGWRGQISTLTKMKGEAFVLFLRSQSELQEPQLTVLSGLLHRCRQTVLADSNGQCIVYGRLRWLRILPKVLASAFNDVFVFATAWVVLGLLRIGARPVIRPPSAGEQKSEGLDLAYLYPFPLDSARAGGALSHVKGFLSGVAASGGRCEVFSARSLPAATFPQHIIARKRFLFLFRESLMLSYNLRFAKAVRRLLRGRSVCALYQRHGGLSVAGALLSLRLGLPLILEYNGSEVWMANYWDPARFRTFLRLCEEVSLSRAHKIVVVSEASRKELTERGIPKERILFNPNAVDPAVFHPGCGGEQVREQLGWASTDIVAAFVGSFSYWHGIQVLVQAIHQLVKGRGADATLGRLRFLLVGEGPLYAEARCSLDSVTDNAVRFTGIIPHDLVPTYLDSADILLSPHVPMPDGRPFFGSPTKLFEYMAMGKAIVASDLDQLSSVLEQGRTAWLVEPGSVSEFAAAITLLARNPGLREQLGRNSRSSALAEHTWQQNAARVLAFVRQPNTSRAMNSAVAAEGD